MDLSLVTSEDMVDELAKRHTGVLLAVTDIDPKSGNEKRLLRYRGGWTITMGLLAYAKHFLLFGKIKKDEDALGN
jgi:hypothetical protein